MKYLVMLLMLLLYGCANTTAVVTSPQPLIEEEVTVPLDKKIIKPPLHKQGKWWRWHKYAEIVTCNINSEGFKTCEYTLCTGADVWGDKGSRTKALRGHRSGPNFRNNYYFMYCYETKRDTSSLLTLEH